MSVLDFEILSLKALISSPQKSHTNQPPFMPSNNRINYSRSGLLQNPNAVTNSSSSQPASSQIFQYKEPLGAISPPTSPAFRLYIFKEGQEIEMIRLVGQSFFLIGRDTNLCPIKAIHPSVSKQHAVLQFRKIWKCK